ncbi:MAG: 23S rRNA (adenine(2503)-C(2))-methyltransferase RlmN [Bacteroidales bacterium]|nr:23S rRNA (adenine(2503)-C(2))-methyltransferase RlmN [Bacteroidales bacterium]
MKESLFGKSIDELIPVVKESGLPAFTARQIAEWLYKHRVQSIYDMTNLSKRAREVLAEKYIIGRMDPVSVMVSADETKKYLFPAGENKFIESAYIPEKNRNTLCLSCQIGCRFGCKFCITGRQGLQGNLSTGEILNQVVSIPEADKITNLVYMGMGEPFDNTENVIRSVTILTSEWGFAMSPRRITVSTIGIIPGIKQFLSETDAHLAVSMHSPFSEERGKLMPVENKYPIKEIMKVIKGYEWGRQRRISFEYIMFKGINDSDRHVNELTRLLGGLRCRINLIRFHSVPGMPYESSSDKTILGFKDKLTSRGITATIRASRGEDIMAACGMLSTIGQGAGSREQGEVSYER